jgi:hypothetical protein
MRKGSTRRKLLLFLAFEVLVILGPVVVMFDVSYTFSEPLSSFDCAMVPVPNGCQTILIRFAVITLKSDKE